MMSDSTKSIYLASIYPIFSVGMTVVTIYKWKQYRCLIPMHAGASQCPNTADKAYIYNTKSYTMHVVCMVSISTHVYTRIILLTINTSCRWWVTNTIH